MPQGIGNFFSGLLQGLGSTYLQHKEREHQDELRKEQAQMQLFQAGADKAIATGDTEALGRIFKMKSEYLNAGSGSTKGKKAGAQGKQGKDDIIGMLGDMILQGVQPSQMNDSELPMLNQTGYAGQPTPMLPQREAGMTFTAKGEPTQMSERQQVELTPLQAQQNLGARVNPQLTPKPFFMTDEQMLNRDVNRLERLEEVKSKFRTKELQLKLDAAQQQTLARYNQQRELVGLRADNKALEKLKAKAAEIAYARGATEVSDLDTQLAGQQLLQDSKDRHDKAVTYIAKSQAETEAISTRLQQNQQRIDNWLNVNKERNDIMRQGQTTREGQLQLGQAKFDYQKHLDSNLRPIMAEMNKQYSRLNALNNDIANATKNGDETTRDESIREAIQVKTRIEQLQVQLDTNMGTNLTEADTNIGNRQDPRVGKTVEKDGKRYKVVGVDNAGNLQVVPLP